ncbi:MAG: CHAT domain-containing protein, partial [Bacteroidales bacterium]|nr:CHAT domain-containing protein [Bacteroidales bacterium]
RELNYLINDFEIVYNYSGSLWWNTRKNTGENAKYQNTEENVYESFVGFAPVFDDVRENNQRDTIVFDSDKYNLAHRSYTHTDKRFQELPYSRDEIEQINCLFKQEDKNGTVYLDQHATKSNFLQNIKDCKYVHIATHGFSNDKSPELCGLAFYPSETSSGSEIDAGLSNWMNYYNHNVLFSGEMYGLDIEADLLVLSACETGIGKLAKGEGLLAMTRGFLYSGVNNIVFSLWKVNDKYTRDLMVEFYKEILSGHTYSSALRIAKLRLIKDPESSLPKFWSSFLLIGE